jgi:hypothetical protein
LAKDFYKWGKQFKDFFLALLGPLGLIISVTINLVKRWGEVKKAFRDEGMIGAIKKIGSILFDSFLAPIKQGLKFGRQIGPLILAWMGPIGSFISALINVFMRWKDIKNAFMEKGILGGIMAIGKAILEGMIIPVEKLLSVLSKIPGVGKFIGKGAEALKGARGSLFKETAATTPASSRVSQIESRRLEEKRTLQTVAFKDLPRGTKKRNTNKGTKIEIPLGAR